MFSGLCREAGLVSVGVITIDGTKIKANASMDQNRSYSGLVRDILREAEEEDQREDQLYGDRRGDELPEQLRTRPPVAKRWRTRSGGLAERKGKPVDDHAAKPEPEKLEIDLEATVFSRPVLKRGGRIEWLRVARQELEARRAARARRFCAIAMTACSRRSSGWRRTTRSTWTRSRPTSAGG